MFNRKKRFSNYNYTFISQTHALEADFEKLHNQNDLIESEVKIWEKGIPTYNLERFLLVQDIENLIGDKNLLLFAHYTGNLSLRGMAISAFEFVEKLGTTRR